MKIYLVEAHCQQCQATEKVMFSVLNASKRKKVAPPARGDCGLDGAKAESGSALPRGGHAD